MKFAAIDIGTNAARLLIAEVQQLGGHMQFLKLAYYRVPLRLGEEVFEKGKILAKKALKFQQTMHAFKFLAEANEVDKLRAVATSAMREASNRKKIVNQIFEQTDIQIEVISGEEEARLILQSFDRFNFQKQEQFVVVDVGGGSTEISIFENGQKLASRSFELGTIRILKGKTAPQTWVDFSTWIEQNKPQNQTFTVFGTGGNINQALKIIAPNTKATLSLGSLKNLHEELMALSFEERCLQFQLKPDRADVIVPALQIYMAALNALGQESLVVPKIGLADGVIYQLFLEHTNL